jgi:clan AA aspartic protease
MIGGTVNRDLQATILLTVHFAPEAALAVTAIIDTGFNGHVALPRDVIESLDLPVHSYTEGRLADGRVVTLARYRMRINWGGELRDVIALAVEGAALLGTALLADHTLRVDFVPGGQVTVRPLSDASEDSV